MANAGSVKPFAFAGNIANGNDDMGDDDADINTTMRLEALLQAPPQVRRRIAALRKLQMSVLDAEAEFFKEVHALECKYAPKFDSLHDDRKAIINGQREVNDEEAAYPLFPESESELAEKFKQQVSVSDSKASKENVKGVPEFWLNVLRNVELTAEMIQENDEAVLKHLIDVRVKLSEDPMTFTVEFEFAPNEHFANTTLVKTYKMRCAVDPKEPAEFDGPEIIASEGCEIKWAPEKDITKKLVKKKQKNKKNPNQSRFVTKEVKADSFFNFFDPPKHVSLDDEDIDDAEQMLLHLDFEIGQTLRDHVVPHAVFHYTREATELDDDDDFAEDEDSEFDEDGDDDDEE